MYHGYFVHRFFHADPHAGNVFAAPGGPATLIDWAWSAGSTGGPACNCSRCS